MFVFESLVLWWFPKLSGVVVFTHGIIRCLYLKLSGVALFTTTQAVMELTSVVVFTHGADWCYSVYPSS